MDASLCGVLRAFFADFLSLLSGMKRSVPLSTTVSVFAFVVMLFLLWAWGASAALRCTPARRRDRGSKGKGGRGGGGSPGLHKRIAFVEAPSGSAVRAEGRGDRPGRSRIFRDFTLARARAEPLAPNRKRASVPQRSEGQSAVARPVKKAPAGGSA